MIFDCLKARFPYIETQAKVVEIVDFFIEEQHNNLQSNTSIIKDNYDVDSIIENLNADDLSYIADNILPLEIYKTYCYKVIIEYYYNKARYTKKIDYSTDQPLKTGDTIKICCLIQNPYEVDINCEDTKALNKYIKIFVFAKLPIICFVSIVIIILCCFLYFSQL